VRKVEEVLTCPQDRSEGYFLPAQVRLVPCYTSHSRYDVGSGSGKRCENGHPQDKSGARGRVFHSDGTTQLVTEVTLDGEDPATESDCLELEAPDTEATDGEESPLVDPTRPTALR